MSTFDWTDLAAYTGLPRITGLIASPDGTRVVATMQAPNPKRAKYVTSLWEIPLEGGEPTRLTSSDEGETDPAFRPDGGLLFASQRGGDELDGAAVWELPARGEAVRIARRAGGLSGPVVAAVAGTTVVSGSRLVHSTEADDAGRRAQRKERATSAILHTGMPIRYWDHEIGDTAARLLLVGDDGALDDLVPDAGDELARAEYAITADGTTLATSWRPRGSRGRQLQQIAVVDVASRRTRVIGADEDWELGTPVIAPDGSQVACGHERLGGFDVPVELGLSLVPVSGGERRPVDLGDLTPAEWAWSPDSSLLFVSGDRHGRGAVVVVDPVDGRVRAELAGDAVYSALCPLPDGTVVALRSAMDSAPAPVRLDPSGDLASLPNPAPTPPLPGAVTELDVDSADGGRVHTWLFEPPASDTPAPVMLWIHGGPFSSWNAWSWRWSPWVAVARGWAVVLPDPALSTGYGQGWIDRAWPYRADVVWDECERALDAVLGRPGLDATQTALLGASFGGFMTSWIAGHTDRFGAIVTHAGLWALDQQHATTDAADYKTRIFGRLADHPDWYAAYSPHNSVDHITTPMLIVHGSRDFRVPVSEALRMWWDLVSRWDGPADELPHRFLQFTAQNHWILTPTDAEVWYDAVLGFCAEHVRGESWTPSTLL